MLACWKYDPQTRPTAEDLFSVLEKSYFNLKYMKGGSVGAGGKAVYSFLSVFTLSVYLSSSVCVFVSLCVSRCHSLHSSLSPLLPLLTLSLGDKSPRPSSTSSSSSYSSQPPLRTSDALIDKSFPPPVITTAPQRSNSGTGLKKKT